MKLKKYLVKELNDSILIWYESRDELHDKPYFQPLKLEHNLSYRGESINFVNCHMQEIPAQPDRHKPERKLHQQLQPTIGALDPPISAPAADPIAQAAHQTLQPNELEPNQSSIQFERLQPPLQRFKQQVQTGRHHKQQQHSQLHEQIQCWSQHQLEYNKQQLFNIALGLIRFAVHVVVDIFAVHF